MRLTGLVSFFLAAMFAGGCDSSISDPTPQVNGSDPTPHVNGNSTIRFSVVVDGDAWLFDNTDFVAVINGKQAIPLTTDQQAYVVVSAGEQSIEIREASGSFLERSPWCTPTSPVTQSFMAPAGGDLTITVRFDCPPAFNQARVRLTVIPQSGDTRAEIPVTFTDLDILEVHDRYYSFLIKPNQPTDFMLPPGYYWLHADSRFCREAAEPDLFWDAFQLEAYKTVLLTITLPCS